MFVKEDDGRWSITVNSDGPPQKYYGETQDEVVAELTRAQEHATRTIREQKRQLRTTVTPDADVPAVTFRPRSLTADERYVLTQRLGDPSQSAEAVRELIEAELGAPVEAIRNTLTVVQDNQIKAQFQREANTFVAAHPEFKQSEKNDESMLAYLRTRNMGYTARNLEIAFEDLKDVLELKEIPSQQPATPVARPRQASTGIPARSNVRVNGDVKVGLTVEELNNMSPEDYRRRLSDPKFAAAVNKLTAIAPRP